MPKRRRSACTTLRLSFLSGASATFAVVGSRFRPILRSVSPFSPDVQVKFNPLTQNTRYVVVSGARRKEEDWDPAENGGFAVHGPSRNPIPHNLILPQPYT